MQKCVKVQCKNQFSHCFYFYPSTILIIQSISGDVLKSLGERAFSELGLHFTLGYHRLRALSLVMPSP
jgi:ferritin-like protein